MSWTSCMKKKIEDEWGAIVKYCVDGANSGDLKKIAECILELLPNLDPEVVAATLAFFSTECAFDAAPDDPARARSR